MPRRPTHRKRPALVSVAPASRNAESIAPSSHEIPPPPPAGEDERPSEIRICAAPIPRFFVEYGLVEAWGEAKPAEAKAADANTCATARPASRSGVVIAVEAVEAEDIVSNAS